MNGLFKYEPHLHTSQGSKCGMNTGAEMARAHKEAGYTGIFVTDHFFNGNTAVPKDLPWCDRVNAFCAGYEDAKGEGDLIGLDVFFGFEFGVGAADFLIYNLDKEWLLAHENIDLLPAREAFSLMRSDGGFIVHAHPFRERDYIDHIKLFPDCVDAVETLNAANSDLFNDRAKWFADSYGLPYTAGSDIHRTEISKRNGVIVGQRLNGTNMYRDFVIAQKVTLF